MNQLFYNLFVLILIIPQTLQSSQQKNKCQALILAASGDMGAYQAGAIKGLVNNITNSKINWDLFGGISSGAIQAVFMSQYANGTEQKMADELEKFWYTFTYENIYQDWPLGILQGLNSKDGLYDFSPLENSLKQLFSNGTWNRLINIVATDSQNGELIRFNESLSKAEMIKAVMASSATPLLFAPVNYKQQFLISGNVVTATDLNGAIKRCIDKGFSQTNIIIDAIFTENQNLDNYTDADSLQNFNRFQRIERQRKTYREIIEAIETFPKVHWRYAVSPSKHISTSKLPFKYSEQETGFMIELGYSDGENVSMDGDCEGNICQSWKNIYMNAKQFFNNQG